MSEISTSDDYGFVPGSCTPEEPLELRMEKERVQWLKEQSEAPSEEPAE